MSTRAEILSALTDHPAGLTLKELAPRCPSAEFDLQIVGGMLATLKHENVIHCSGFREHQLLYCFGKQPVPAHELRESPITLNSPSVVSEAARAIADMRRRTNTPHPTEQQKEQAMAKPTLVERCLAALKQHGPCNQEQLAKHTNSTPGSVSTITGQLKARGVRKFQPAARGAMAIYSLPGQPLPDALATGADLGKKSYQAKGHGPAAQSGSRNGSGSAETPAAGPALFDGAIEALKAKRAEAQAIVEKCDRAIEAVRALA